MGRWTGSSSWTSRVRLGGAYCTKLLVDAGAEVIKLEPPDGDPLRRRSPSRSAIPKGHDSAIFQFLAASKQSMVIDPAVDADIELATRLIELADAVVWTPGTAVADHPSLAPKRLAEQFPSLIVTAITPFGLDGPWAARPASDLTLQAWSGGVWARGVPGRAPVAVGGGQDQWASGVAAAASTLLARIGSHRTGRGSLVDVSALEALAQWLFGYGPMTSMDIAGRPLRDVRSVHIPGVEEAKDGWVGLMVGTAQQWFDFCAMVSHPEWTDDPSLLLVTTRSDHGSGIAPAIAEWTSQRTVEEIRELASAFQIPNSPIGDGSSIPTFDHFVERGSFVENPHGGFLQPVSPYRLGDIAARPFGPAPVLGGDTTRLRARADERAVPASGSPDGGDGAGAELPLAGVRVLDLTSLFAGPFFTRVMGMFGAEVIHLESISRPDLYRMYSLRQVGTDDDWCEWTPQFSCCNTNKKDLTLDLQTPRGRDLLLELVATCDVVVENFSARVMENLRLDYDTLRGGRDDLIMVRMPGFGVDGPWRDVPAFAPIIEDAAGITWMTGYPDDKPQEAQSVGDPNAALHALTATLLALEHRRRTGKGACVEASMVGAALNIAAEQVVEYSAYGKLLMRSGNRNPLAAPQGLYRSSRGRRTRRPRRLGGDRRGDRRAVVAPAPQRWATRRGRARPGSTTWTVAWTRTTSSTSTSTAGAPHGPVTRSSTRSGPPVCRSRRSSRRTSREASINSWPEGSSRWSSTR